MHYSAIDIDSLFESRIFGGAQNLIISDSLYIKKCLTLNIVIRIIFFLFSYFFPVCVFVLSL